LNQKTLTAEVTSNDGVKIDATITTESIDRDGEVLISQGMDTSEFDLNPVVFYNHDYAQPVGRITGLKRGKNKIDATIEFAKRPADFEGSYFPEFVESLVSQGIVKGISVGFVPLEGGVRKASKQDREQFGDRVRQVYSKWKLYEVSIAPLPANPNALVTAVRKGLVNREDVKTFIGEIPEQRRIEIVVPKRGRLSTL
jgi:HK97 family phage prohead protease